MIHKNLSEDEAAEGATVGRDASAMAESRPTAQGLVITMTRALAPPGDSAHVVPPTPSGPSQFLELRRLTKDHSLAHWAARYLAMEVCDVQSRNTLDAKSRDLTAFVRWFIEMNGHGDISRWSRRNTQIYLHTLAAHGRAPTTINRAFATLRHFARWAHDQPGHVFGLTGLPTQKIKERPVDEPDCKKMASRDMHRLFDAAERLIITETRKNARPRRAYAILAVLYYTGLRVSELLALRLEQYNGRYLLDVQRKGKSRTKQVFVPSEGRRILADYLEYERPLDAAGGQAGLLFVSQVKTKPLTRCTAARILDHIAEEASKHTAPMAISPHRLRHTFAAEVREKSGSDSETARLLGHGSLRYVGRYARQTQEEREHLLETLGVETA